MTETRIMLCKKTTTVNAMGGLVETFTRRTVWAAVKSASQAAYDQAAAQGLKHEIYFVLRDYLDYKDEDIIEYGGTHYHVGRTYRKGKKLEIDVFTEVNAEVITSGST